MMKGARLGASLASRAKIAELMAFKLVASFLWAAAMAEFPEQ